MQLRHLATLLPANGATTTGRAYDAKVTAVCYSPNGKKLAVCGMDRVVRLFDDTGEPVDKFSTKPADKGLKNYVVRAMVFAPDSTKLAIAQSDNIVFVYKLGTEWGDKKSICNKFLQASPVTSLSWPIARPNELVYGLADGKVKVGQLRSNKPATLYATDSYVCCVTSSTDGSGVCSAHLDGSIHRFFFASAGNGLPQTKIAVHAGVPYALAWGHSICVAGNDSTVVFYDVGGGIEKRFDFASNGDDKDEAQACGEFTCAAFNPTGDTVVLGNWNSFYTFTYKARQDVWEDLAVKVIDNLYAVTALSWKADGSRLAVGGLFGSLDLFDACIRRYQYKGKFEFTYSSLSQVIVKRLETGTRIVLKSLFGLEITKINIFQDRYVVANTTDHGSASPRGETKETLLLGDLQTYKLSEVEWANGGKEKFVFDNPSCCIVHRAGELALVEYGVNETLGTVRTDHISGHLLSVRLNERRKRLAASAKTDAEREAAASGLENKKIAYLLDAQTIAVRDFVTGSSTTISQDSKIDWLELNPRGSMLLFRDKRRQLHLYEIETQQRTTLLNHCTYVQWVPDSDVVVAQNRGSLCVWYNIHTPDQVTVHQIRGDIEDIERSEGRTEVIVDEQLSTASYLLDEALIQFGTAIDDHLFDKAADILETLELSPEAEGMWRKLEEMALHGQNTQIAERCAAALGNVGRARYLHRLNKAVAKSPALGMDHYSVRSTFSLLMGDAKEAESALLNQGRVDEAIAMHQKLHNFDRAVAIAEEKSHPEAVSMRRDHFQYLLDSHQSAKAAEFKEAEGDHLAAIDLYLKGGMPGRAAKLVKHHNIHNPPSVLERVAAALAASQLHEHAGEFYERMDQLQRAMDAYIKAAAFRKAVELARKHFPGRVVELQEAWGDHLVEQKQTDMAINHYIEASCASKAVEAAFSARQWTKASQMLENFDADAARPFFRRLARHFDGTAAFPQAEKFYIAAGAPDKAVEMYTRANLFSRAHAVASSYMAPRDVSLLYISEAQKLEAEGKFKDAERLYLTVSEPDLAINMYKKARKYSEMVQLVEQHRRELLKETHQYLAQHLEAEGNLRDAEHHYVEAGEWLSAVNMYRTNDSWDEAMRVAKAQGGPNAAKRVAYAWALSLGGDAGAKLLTKQGLIEPAIDYAVESGAFDHAFELARAACPAKLPDVHLKHALFLEDEERYKDAEAEFVAAHKPREAIDMYLHQQAWADALAVANKYDPAAAPDIYVAHARAEADAGRYGRAEELFLLAAKPDLALSVYKDAGMWAEAMALAKLHLPHQLNEVSLAYSQAESGGGAVAGSSGGAPVSRASYLAAGQRFEQQKQMKKAVQAYLACKPGSLDAQDCEAVYDAAVSVLRKQAAASHISQAEFRDGVLDVSQRLRQMSSFDAAAELLREVGDLRAAVSCALEGRCWAKAHELAAGSPMEAEVAAAYQRVLASNEDADGLLEMGHKSSAMQVLVQRKDWHKLWETARRENVHPAACAKYAGLQAASVLHDGGPSKLAVDALTAHGAPPPAAHMQLYKALVGAVLGEDSQVEKNQGAEYAKTVSDGVLRRF